MLADSGSQLVSVIVVNWNRRDLLRACLESLFSQQGAVTLQVIVVDNGSTDGSLEMLARDYSPGSQCPVTVIANRDNRGFCAANNQGFAEAKGSWVALLNNDAEACPVWISEMLAVTHNRSDVGMVACKILVHEDPTRIDKVGHLIYPDGQNRGRGTGQIDTGQFDHLDDVLWPDGCAALYRKSMIDQIGGFDEDLFAYGDDAELGLRARIAGWNCLYAPKAVARHHRASTLGKSSTRRVELIERNRVLLAVKLFPWSLLWLNAAFYLARLVAGVWAAMRNRGEGNRFPGLPGKLRLLLALLRADLAALALLPRTFRKRRQIRHLRKLSNAQLRRLLSRHRISLTELMEQAI